jgi:enoyl-CoA hydratase/carnithine racemase
VVRTFGMQLGTEIALAGRVMTAQELATVGFCRVAKSQDSLIDEALDLARSIGDMSPDAVIVTRAGLREAWETASVERASQITSARYDRDLFEGENIRIGLAAFAGKKKPKWVPSKM